MYAALVTTSDLSICVTQLSSNLYQLRKEYEIFIIWALAIDVWFSSPIGIVVFTKCSIMSAIHSAIMIGHGTQIIIAWIGHSSRGQRHIIADVELIHRKSYVILNFLACPHRCGQIKFKSAKETESNVSMYIYGSIGVDWSAYRLRCTTSTGGTFEISNFLMASRSLLHLGQNQSLIFSPSKYMSMHSFRSLCLLCYGNSKLKLEKPS